MIKQTLTIIGYDRLITNPLNATLQLKLKSLLAAQPKRNIRLKK